MPDMTPMEALKELDSFVRHPMSDFTRKRREKALAVLSGVVQQLATANAEIEQWEPWFRDIEQHPRVKELRERIQSLEAERDEILHELNMKISALELKNYATEAALDKAVEALNYSVEVFTVLRKTHESCGNCEIEMDAAVSQALAAIASAREWK